MTRLGLTRAGRTRAGLTCVRGFTLIELLITLVIGGILMMTAVPALTTFKRNAELTSASNTLISSISAARGEAMKRGMNAMVVPSDGVNWSSGWLVFVDVNRNFTYNASDNTILSQNTIASTLTVTGTNIASGGTPYILFDASGYSKTKAGGFTPVTLTIARNDVSGTDVYSEMRRLKIAQTGRVRTCKPANASDTTCSASVED
ncbi:MAG: GspH/FimT family pseudopilin [Burkholderiaceae bacterium]|nr:GspH/FimT family pseudopilin [Burkholderiaceae bacterium]